MSQKVEKDAIVSMITTVGEFVGRLKQESETEIVLTRPRIVMHNKDGMGFGAGIAMTGVEEPEEAIFYKTNVVFMNKTNEAIEKAWTTFTSGIEIATP
jgi:hypothetical protein